ncbi:MAG: heavy metal translocating P-type ATPase, partial [bacterium]
MRVRHRNEQLGEGVAQLLPPVAVRIGDSGDESVPVASLRPGDHIRVAAGETFGCDGRVITGESAVNESLLTGEAEPVRKQPGSQVCAGSVNGNAPLVIAVEALGQSTRLSSILTLVDRAQSEKPPQRAAADRIAGIFVAAVLVIAGGVALAWWAIEPARALWVTISVLVVTCPCALSLATPAALAVASGELRRSGFLVTRGHVIEALAEADTVVFDKTGTLTEGRKKVESVVALSDLSKSRVLAICRSLERGSAHPIAEAFDDAGQAGNAENVEHHLAEGVSGWVDGQFFALGKPAYVERLCGLADMRSGFEPRAGQTEILLASRGQAVAWIQLNDSVRRGVAHTIEMLTARGLNVELLSGDKVEAVSAMADSVGIDIYRGEVTPEEKLAHIRQLQNRGHRVVMVGDGINDVPVLSGADVSVAIGEATDLTRIHADSILLSSDFAALIKALD